MTASDKFSVYYLDGSLVLRCDVCHARDMYDGDVVAWDNREDINLSAVISRSQGHWAKFHDQEVQGG